MFYCNACAARNDWPESFHQNFAPCQCCGAHTACSDIPAKDLPFPIEHEPSYFKELNK